jgi:hypothetical protein
MVQQCVCGWVGGREGMSRSHPHRFVIHLRRFEAVHTYMQQRGCIWQQHLSYMHDPGRWEGV